jgi:hypothetical protein
VLLRQSTEQSRKGKYRQQDWNRTLIQGFDGILNMLLDLLRYTRRQIAWGVAIILRMALA